VSVVVSAPGKLMVSGEYVVLDGVPALVSATSARLWAHGSPPRSDGSGEAEARSGDPPGLPPEALLALRYAEAELGPVAMTIALDASALRRGSHKLGLGSSSAASAATAGLALAFHGLDPAEERSRVFDLALRGHRAIAPQGSGADVAAASLGGLVDYRADAPEAATSRPWPSGIATRVVWTGVPARTSELLGPVRSMAEEDPAAYAEATAPLVEAAGALREAVLAGDGAAAGMAARAHGRAMGLLGGRAGARILTPSLARVAALAEAAGGGAKPSGAGGGDVAIAFFDEEERAEEFGRACDQAGLDLLPIRLGGAGVRREAGDAPQGR
jgi:phosphomevalonate kinase